MDLAEKTEPGNPGREREEDDLDAWSRNGDPLEQHYRKKLGYKKEPRTSRISASSDGSRGALEAFGWTLIRYLTLQLILVGTVC